jgi:dipeptide/tripeptide permease
MLVLYLTESRKFPSETAIRIGGNFGMVTYGLAALSGFLADFLGYRRAMLCAYTILATGYFLTGQATDYYAIIGSLLLIAFGASLIKPIITGTVQKSCTDDQRSVGFSIYYMLVNIGGFLGPNISAKVRGALGVEKVFWFSTCSAVVALLLTVFAYSEPAEREGPQTRRKIGDFLGDFLRVVTDVRLMLLFLFVAGWWSMFFQFFNVLPLYLRDDLKVSDWLQGFIPALGAGAIICLQVVVGYLVRDLKPFRAILFAMVLSASGVALMGIYPSVVLAGLGVVVFSLGEMTYSAHFYHYLGNIAPPGQVGMYMGFAFLPIAIGSFISGQIGGPLQTYFREVVKSPQMMWFAFAAVGVASAIGLAVLTIVTGSGDHDEASSVKSP